MPLNNSSNPYYHGNRTKDMQRWLLWGIIWCSRYFWLADPCSATPSLKCNHVGWIYFYYPWEHTIHQVVESAIHPSKSFHRHSQSWAALARANLCVLASMCKLIRKNLGIYPVVCEVTCTFCTFIGGGEKSMAWCPKECCLMPWLLRTWLGSCTILYKGHMR